MHRSKILSLVVAGSLALSPVPAAANDALFGGIVGGIIGGAIANGGQKSTKKVYRKKTYNSAARQTNRETQTALNYFGFNAGTADGVMGSRSRAAVSAYQAHLGYTPTGRITQYERDFLISSYYRAQSGGPATAQLIASNPQGVRGLLTVYRDEQMNGTGSSATAAIGGHYGLPSVVAAAVNEIAKSSDPSAEQLVQRSGFIQLADINGDGQTDYVLDTSVTGSAFWCNAQSCSVRVFASTPDGYERNDFQAFNVTPAMFSCTRGTCSKTDNEPQLATQRMIPQQPAPQQQQPQPQMAAVPSTPVPSAQPVVRSSPTTDAAAPQVPNFFNNATAPAPSLASHCNKVSLLTATNGGFTKVSTMTDPGLALSEQMCLTRTYAIAMGEELMAQVQGASPQQIAQQCASFGPLLRDHVSAVSVQAREDVVRGVAGFVLTSGMSPEQLEMTAQICLASGYKTDDMNVAMGSALLLIALGQSPYSEILGHHLSQGFGATKRDDLAVAWYSDAIDAVARGTTPVFAPRQPERMDIVRQASLMLSGDTKTGSPTPETSVQTDLPVFSITE